MQVRSHTAVKGTMSMSDKLPRVEHPLSGSTDDDHDDEATRVTKLPKTDLTHTREATTECVALEVPLRLPRSNVTMDNGPTQPVPNVSQQTEAVKGLLVLPL